MVTLIISDVIGNPLEFIASGPTVMPSTTFDDAKRVLEKYHLLDRLSDNVHKALGTMKNM